MTPSDFVAAIGRSQGVCLLPFGIIEKHGPAEMLQTPMESPRDYLVYAIAGGDSRGEGGPDRAEVAEGIF